MNTPNNVAKLLLSIPYFIKPGPLPPCRVVNDLLKAGEYDAGMSGSVKWMPFALSDAEYELVVEELRQLSAGLLDDVSPSDIRTYDEWHNWRLIKDAGKGGAELSLLFKKRTELSNKVEKQVRMRASNDEIAEIQMELMDIDALIGDILIEANKNKNAN